MSALWVAWRQINANDCSVKLILACGNLEQSLSVEDKVLLAQAASERAAIVAKYDKVSTVTVVTV